jgi:hypothetical protein
MKVGLFSPLPPAHTGVADYSAAVLPYLRELGPVETNPAECDIALYQLGNNSLHREIYQRAVAEPGVVVLHDAVLQHLLLGMLDASAYEEEFVYNYGEWSRDLGRRLWLERARSGADARYFTHPMLKRIATVSRAIIVHNPAAAHLVREHVPGACIVEIPHLFVRPDLPPGTPSQGTLQVGVFGYQRETKRLAVVLRAFERAIQAGADARLLVAGEFASATYEKTIQPLLDQPWILRTRYLSESQFWGQAAATDVCINLRYPSAGETSGIGVRMMGIGKCVIFTADATVASIPETACLRVDPGPQEAEMLTAYICWLARDRDALAAIGSRAAEHIAREHAPEKIARQYWDVLSRR